jgi:hypothetical protein
MIVVASHNRIDLLTSILNNLTDIDLHGHEVLIVDTNSDDPEYITFFESCKNEYPQFIFERKNYTCWDSGAYIHAYRNYPSEKYIFLQDSLTITNRKLIPMWDAFLDIYDVVPFINFGYWYESEEQKLFGEAGLPEHKTMPIDSIFGPIFGVRKTTMDSLPAEWLIEPMNKLQGCGMERRWSYMFHSVGASKHYIEYSNFQKDQTIYNLKSNIHKMFFYRL